MKIKRIYINAKFWQENNINANLRYWVIINGDSKYVITYHKDKKNKNDQLHISFNGKVIVRIKLDQSFNSIYDITNKYMKTKTRQYIYWASSKQI